MKIFFRVRKFFENRRGNPKQGEMHHGLRGMDAPEPPRNYAQGQFLGAANTTFDFLYNIHTKGLAQK